MNNNQTAFDIDELYFKANNDMAVILNMVRIASLSKKKGKLLAAIEQKILDTMGGYIDSVDDEDLQLDMCEATLPINYEGSDYADDEDGFIEASVDGILAEYERKEERKGGERQCPLTTLRRPELRLRLRVPAPFIRLTW